VSGPRAPLRKIERGVVGRWFASATGMSFRAAGLLALGLCLIACGDDGASPVGGGDGNGANGQGANGSGAEGAGANGQGGEGAVDPPDPVIPSAHPRILLNPLERTRLATALATPTPAAARYKAFVDQKLEGGDPYDFRGWHAAMIYALDGDEAYADLAIAFADEFVLGEEARVANGEAASVAGDSYLEVGDRVGDVMLVLDWCFDRVTPEQRDRWTAWANQAVWNVWHPEEASWGGVTHPWSGWSIDDPVNNYYFSFLRATLLLGLATYEENPEAPGWVEQFRTTKIELQLVPRYEAELVGGGSREGTGYGVAMAGLFRLYDIWQKSTGEPIAGLTTHAELSIAHMVHSVVPTLDRIAPIGDHARDSTAALFDYHRDYLLALGALYPELPTTQASRTLLAESSVPEMGQGFMRFSDFLFDPTGAATAPLGSLYPAYRAEGAGHIFARSDWTGGATWIGLIAGAYAQSHAHHDQGSLLLFQGEWLAYDSNILSHSGIRNEEELHNLVRVESGGDVVRMIEGSPPADLRALSDDAEVFYFAVDSAPVYGSESPIDSNLRELVWIKPNVLVVRDVVTTSDPSAARIYQLNTPLSAQVSGRRVHMQGDVSSLDLHVLQPSSGPIGVVSWAAVDDDMDGGYRIEAAQSGDPSEQFLTVLGVDDAVDSASASGDVVTVELADGRTAVVTFSDGAAPVVDVTGAGAFSRTLSNTVDAFPLLAP
jgi:hypothetical protein